MFPLFSRQITWGKNQFAWVPYQFDVKILSKQQTSKKEILFTSNRPGNHRFLTPKWKIEIGTYWWHWWGCWEPHLRHCWPRRSPRPRPRCLWPVLLPRAKGWRRKTWRLWPREPTPPWVRNMARPHYRPLFMASEARCFFLHQRRQRKNNALRRIFALTEETAAVNRKLL